MFTFLKSHPLMSIELLTFFSMEGETMAMLNYTLTCLVCKLKVYAKEYSGMREKHKTISKKLSQQKNKYTVSPQYIC